MRRESIAAILLVAACACVVGGVFVWSNDRPERSTWMWRIVFSGVGAGAIVGLIRLQFWGKADLAPDFLSAEVQDVSEQNGFCFVLGAATENGVFFVNAMYQNQYDRPCKARIALRRSQAYSGLRWGRFATTSRRSCLTFPAARAFGIAAIPLPVSGQHQGKKLTLQIGATVDYPEEKGKKVRFREGSLLRYNAEFHSAYLTTLQMLYFFCGGLLFSFPASVTFDLPTGVAESLQGEQSSAQTLWTIGDEVVR